MKERVEWVRQNPKSIVKALTALVVAVFFGLIVYNTTAAYTNSTIVKNNSEQLRTVVQKLVEADKNRERRVSVLIDNNNRQTLILCKLILNQGTVLTPEEIVQVEMACNDRLKVDEARQSSSNAGTEGNTGGNSGNSGSTTQSSPNPTPTPQSTQPNNSQLTPEPSFLERIMNSIKERLWPADPSIHPIK